MLLLLTYFLLHSSILLYICDLRAFKATSSQCVQDVEGLLILGSRECIAWPRPLEVGTARYRQRPNFGLLHSRRRRRSLVVLEQYTALPNQYAYERRRQVRRRFVSTGTHRAKGRSFSATEKDDGGLSGGLAAGLSTFGRRVWSCFRRLYYCSWWRKPRRGHQHWRIAKAALCTTSTAKVIKVYYY